MTWTTLPPWLYQNTLPDEELQEVYVREARKKVRQLAAQLEGLDSERADVARALAEARAFCREAEAALDRYRPPRARITAGRKVLPKP